MKNIQQIKALEEFNSEYLKLYHSKQIRFKRNITKLKNSNFKDSVRLVKKKVTAKIGDVKIKRKTISVHNLETYYNFGNPMENIKVAVYTCITNGYDTPKSPLYIGNDTDYYLFTDSLSNGNTIWKEKMIDCNNYKHEANRYYKFHPDVFEKKYDYAIYIDGNVKIISDVTTLCSIAKKSKVGIAMHKHHCRDCAYQEGKACKYYKRGNIDNINKQLEEFKKEGFPVHFGLCEATVIVYDLNNPISKKIAHEWWNKYYESSAKRDQIFFPYVIWKNGFSMKDIGDLGNNIWENPKFVLTGHD